MYVEASINPRKANKPPRKVYNKANTEELKEKLGSIDIEKQLKEQDLTVDQLWNNFKEKVLDIMNRSIPTKMINNSKRRLPCINREMKSLTIKRNKYFKKMKQHPCKKNTDQYRETKRRLQKESRKAYWQYLEHIICYDESIETVQKQKILIQQKPLDQTK